MSFLHPNSELLELSAEQESEVRRRAKSIFQSKRYGTLAITLPGMTPLFMIPLWKWLTSLGLEASTVLLAAMGVMFVWGTIIVCYLRWVHTKYARRAVVDLGYANLCLACGYWLRGLETSEKRVVLCPECGRRCVLRALPGGEVTS